MGQYMKRFMEQYYINKDIVVEEIKRKIEAHKETLKNCDSNISEMVIKGSMSAYQSLLHFLDTIEVKEVNMNNEYINNEYINNEYIEEIYSHLDSIKDTADRMTSGNFMHNKAAIKFSVNTIMKVLELIGLKTQKEE